MNKSTLPAFPASHEFHSYGGMTLRDYFAGQALAGLNMDGLYGSFRPDAIAKDCYDIADAMIAESEKPNE